MFNEYRNIRAKDEGWYTLPGVNQDKSFITTMLIKDYDIEEVLNQNDIEECIVDILKKWKEGEEHIRRLHFHFSGHGIINQAIDDCEIDKAEQPIDANNPILHCLMGNNGETSLYSVDQIKQLLNQANAEVITITLDCCRSYDKLREIAKKKISLGKLPRIPHDNWPKTAVFYPTCESTLASYDENSFSKELWKVYQEQDHHISISKMGKLVNESWSNRMVDQQCTIEMVNVGDNWKNKSWPI